VCARVCVFLYVRVSACACWCVLESVRGCLHACVVCVCMCVHMYACVCMCLHLCACMRIWKNGHTRRTYQARTAADPTIPQKSLTNPQQSPIFPHVWRTWQAEIAARSEQYTLHLSSGPHITAADTTFEQHTLNLSRTPYA